MKLINNINLDLIINEMYKIENNPVEIEIRPGVSYGHPITVLYKPRCGYIIYTTDGNFNINEIADKIKELTNSNVHDNAEMCCNEHITSYPSNLSIMIKKSTNSKSRNIILISPLTKYINFSKNPLVSDDCLFTWYILPLSLVIDSSEIIYNLSHFNILCSSIICDFGFFLKSQVILDRSIIKPTDIHLYQLPKNISTTAIDLIRKGVLIIKNENNKIILDYVNNPSYLYGDSKSIFNLPYKNKDELRLIDVDLRCIYCESPLGDDIVYLSSKNHICLLCRYCWGYLDSSTNIIKYIFCKFIVYRTNIISQKDNFLNYDLYKDLYIILNGVIKLIDNIGMLITISEADKFIITSENIGHYPQLHNNILFNYKLPIIHEIKIASIS
jgi:hypothetical protein